MTEEWLQQAADDLDAALAQQQTEERAQWEAEQRGWISVKDRLPPEYKRVAVWTHQDGYVPFVVYEDGEWVSEVLRWSGKPTHWMPLPEPPNE